MKRRETKYGSVAVALEQCELRPGQEVVGDMIVTVDKEVEKFAVFKVALVGTVHTAVRRGSGRNETTYHDSHELCHETKKMVPPEVEGTYDGEWHRLPVGEYRMSFAIPVPEDAVPTDKIKRGGARVEYILHAGLVTPDGGMWSTLKSLVKPQQVSKLVTILPVPQPQVESELAEPLSATGNKSFTMSRSKGELSATVHVNKGYAYAGDHVPFRVEVKNNSTKTVQKLGLQFVAYGCITAVNRTDEFVETVVEVMVEEDIKKGETRTVEAVLQIPCDYERVSFLTPLWTRRHGVRVLHRTSGLTRNLAVVAEVSLLKRPDATCTQQKRVSPDCAPPTKQQPLEVGNYSMAPGPGVHPTALSANLYAVPEPSYAAAEPLHSLPESSYAETTAH